MSRILVVDDDEDFRRLLAQLIRGNACHVDQAASAAEARACLSRAAYDVVITDLSMPGESGFSLIEWSREHCPRPAWIVVTGYGTFDTAVQALQLGAFDFLEKPLKGDEAVRSSVRNALAHQRLRSERDRLTAELSYSNQRLRQHVDELEAAHGLLREQSEGIRADLQRAGIIQQALLPREAPPVADFQVQALYRPSHSIGGDLYDVVRLDERRVALLIADAAGHGLSAAMLAVLFRSRLPFVDPETRVPRRPSYTLRAANRALCEGFPAPGLFLTAAYCVLDIRSGVATVASAGHPPLLLLREGGSVERVFHTGPALGLYAEADFAEQEIHLGRGDRLLFYSDGIYDLLPTGSGSAGEALTEALAEQRGLGALQGLVGTLGADGAEAPEDDVTLLMLDATPGQSQLDNGPLRPLPPPSPAPRDFEILVGSDLGRTSFSIQGPACWERSAAFHRACITALDGGGPVMIDLTLCHHMDSTFLGTLHELAQRAEYEDTELRLQGVVPGVEALFEELGMKRVIERMVPSMLPLPTRMTSLVDDSDPHSRARRTLQAHEDLAGLNESNRQEFDPLVALLRREAASASGEPS